jgi:hypothetical protein
MPTKRKATADEAPKSAKRTRNSDAKTTVKDTPKKAAKSAQKTASKGSAPKKGKDSRSPIKKDAPKKAAKSAPQKSKTDSKGSAPKKGKESESPIKKAAPKKAAKSTPKTKAASKGSPLNKGKESSKAPANRVVPVSDKSDVPLGVKRDSRDRLVFEGFPNFRPTLTPKQVIQAGSFGGIYFNPTGGRKSVKYPKGCDIDPNEFPADWFEGLRDEQYKGTRYNIQLNRYKVKSGQNQQQWEEQGWIRDQDKRGWFQWYCRFCLGRRTDDDKRQISRWTGVAGPKGRWKTRLCNLVRDKGGVDKVMDATISPVIRQNLLHWAYELTEKDFLAISKGKT